MLKLSVPQFPFMASVDSDSSYFQWLLGGLNALIPVMCTAPCLAPVRTISVSTVEPLPSATCVENITFAPNTHAWWEAILTPFTEEETVPERWSLCERGTSTKSWDLLQPRASAQQPPLLPVLAHSPLASCHQQTVHLHMLERENQGEGSVSFDSRTSW